MAQALRCAQMTLRRQRSTRDPFYWAGFVLVVDGGLRVPLERKSNLLYVVALGALLLVGLSLLCRYRRQSEPRSPS